MLPKKLGIEATAKNLNDLKLARKREEKEAAEELAAAKELAAKIKECTVTVSMKTGEGGRTFGTVSTKEVAATKGRASYVGERSIGHIDPGSYSSGLLFKALLEAEG